MVRSRIRLIPLGGSFLFLLGLSLFYYRYVPIIPQFQMILLPVCLCVFGLTLWRIKTGTLFFVFVFPLINCIPYFLGIYCHIPHAPTALIVFLFYFFGFLTGTIFSKSEPFVKDRIFRPMILFSILITASAAITFLRYANFFPFLTDNIYELTTNAFGVSAGGAIMSVIFNTLNYLTGLAFFFILLNLMKSEKFIKQVLVVLCLSSLISLCFGFYQRFFDNELGNNLASIQHELVNGTFKDALSFGAFLSMAIPLFLGVLIAMKGILRIILLVCSVMALFMLFFTGSKSGLLSACVALLVFIYLTYRMIPRVERMQLLGSKRAWLVIALIAVLFMSVFFAVFISSDDFKGSATLSRLNFMFDRGVINLMKAWRWPLWKSALQMMKEYPLTGVGIGGYVIELPNYSEKHRVPGEIPQSAENYWLQIGSEMGLVGLVLVLWIFGEIVFRMKQSFRDYPGHSKNKFILAGAIAGVVAFLVNALFHTYIGSYEVKYMFWLMVALIYCLGRIEGIIPPIKALSKRASFIAVLFLTIAFSAVHVWNSTHSLSLESRTRELNLEQNFGFYRTEMTVGGREFNWTGKNAGRTITVNKPVMEVHLHASHPDIRTNPVQVEVYLVKDFFRTKRLLEELTLDSNKWIVREYAVPEEIGEKVIFLIKINRTWNPLKALGVPDPRNLGVAVGKIRFKEKD